MKKKDLYALKSEELVWGEGDDGRVARIFTHRETRKGKQGSLFIIIELSSPSQDGDILVHSLASAFIEGYRTSPGAHEEAFEEALVRTNILLKNMARETTASWLGCLHIILGLWTKKVFLFSAVGSPLLLLLREGVVSEIGKTEKTKEQRNAFEHVFTGAVAENDVLVLLTPGLLEIFPTENLTHILIKYNTFPLEKLEKLLRENRRTVDVLFALLLLHVQKTERKKQERVSVPRAGVAQNLKPDRLVFLSLPRARSHALLLVRSIFFSLKKIDSSRLPALILSPSRIRSILSQYVRFPRYGHITKTGVRLFAAKILSAPRLTRTALLIPLLLITGAVFWITFHDGPRNKEELTDSLQQIESHVAQAENALIFRDKARARTNLSEARLLLSSISSAFSSSDPRLTNLAKKIDGLEDTMLGTIVIEEPKVLWKITNNLGAAPRYLFSNNGKLFAYSDATATMYVKDGEVEKLVFLPDGELRENTPSVFLYSSQRFISFVPGSGMRIFDPATESHDRLDGPLPPQEFDVKDIGSYQEYLYFLGGNGVILKYRLRDSRLVFSEEWTKEPIPLSSAPSFAIDGSIYVTSVENKILKLSNGTVSGNWELPPRFSEGKIIASKDMTYVYLVDRDDSSLLKFSKNGEVLNRYQSPRFNDLTDAIINEAQNKAYLLNDFTVYEIDL